MFIYWDCCPNLLHPSGILYHHKLQWTTSPNSFLNNVFLFFYKYIWFPSLNFLNTDTAKYLTFVAILLDNNLHCRYNFSIMHPLLIFDTSGFWSLTLFPNQKSFYVLNFSRFSSALKFPSQKIDAVLWQTTLFLGLRKGATSCLIPLIFCWFLSLRIKEERNKWENSRFSCRKFLQILFPLNWLYVSRWH